jgi:hypothetical protein
LKWLSVLGAIVVGVATAGCGTGAPRLRRAALAPGSLAYLEGGNAMLARADGSDPRLLGPARSALLAPDGAAVLALSVSDRRASLTLYEPRREGASARVVAVLGAPDYSSRGVRLLGWSPDSRYVVLSAYAFSAGGEEGVLLVLDVRSGRLETLARGTLLGASFAPGPPERIVYARASIVQLDDNEASLWIANLAGTQRRRLTSRGLASWPLWTPAGIYFARLERLGTPTSSPRYGLWRVQPDGSELQRVPSIVGGPPIGPPVASADGRRVVVNLTSPDGAEVWGAMLTRGGWSTERLSLDGSAGGVSSDGAAVLANVPGSEPEVQSAPWSAGFSQLLALGATAAQWSR